MDYSKDDQLRLWSTNLSLVTAIVICILSWFNGVALGWIVVRAALTFLVIYTLTLGSIGLFINTAYPDLNETVPEQSIHQGTLIDISLGDDLNPDSNEAVPLGYNTGLGVHAGQVDPALVSGVGHQQQADIVRRMGWEK